MLGIHLESNEKAALTKVRGTPLHDVLRRILETLDRVNRAQKDDVQLRQGQGRALMIEDLLAEVERQGRGDTL